ncbi:MAG: UvrD-helicase domain-containing protein [Candidatus Eremiobacteraeota bacterium]|nr:UvrD-helicase domain-containing protein [Candidatus Eremiobacteraeota bacterium]
MNAAAVPPNVRAEDAARHSLQAFVAIEGPAGTGKTTALLRRAVRASENLAAGQAIIVSAPSTLAVQELHAALGSAARHEQICCANLGEIAFSILQAYRTDAATSQGAAPPVALIDDVRAQELFSEVAASLYALEWEEFLSAEWDPEITGLRAPERFAATAYRLIRKLRIAGVAPDAFLQSALRGATEFYGHPPNFANPELIEKTPPKYRDSLRVTPQELARQHAREVDLAKILHRLYSAYAERVAARGCLTAVDAVIEAAQLLETHDALQQAWHVLRPFAFIDNAQDLAQCDLRFLRALFGEELRGVTLAGDAGQRTQAFAVPRADKTLENAAERFCFTEQYRSTPAIVQATQAALRGKTAVARSSQLAVARFPTMEAEAVHVASSVARALRDGILAKDIAVIVRSLRCADAYLRALLEWNVPVDPFGEASLYEFQDVEDLLGVLWAVADPFRHDWLLRNLQAPWLALSDATIAALCEEPASAQVPLFAPADEPTDARGRRWDRQRDFRLAWNVLRGDRDTDLSAEVRARLAAFREARAVWLADEKVLSVPALARRIATDTVLVGDASNARGRLRHGLAERLLADLGRFASARPRATLADYLHHVEHVSVAGNDLLSIEPRDPEAVALIDVEAGKGREFSRVFVVDVRAGAFPRYYVPDAFQFTTRAGMIPKENVGSDATAARTAKFTYFQYKLDVRSRYYAEERRALACAISRARDFVSLSAWGRPTRGTSAPEFLEELGSTVTEVPRGGNERSA